MSYTALNETLFSIAREQGIDGESHIISSFRTGLSAGVLQDINEFGADVIPYPNGIQLKVVSSSASDTLLGTGARQVLLHYLNSAYIERSETLNLNGTTPVNTVATDITRIQNMHVLTVGSNGVAVGNISLTNLAGTVTYEYIKLGGNQSLTSHFTIPDNKVGYITSWQATVTKQTVYVRLRVTRDRHDGTLLPGVFIFHDGVTLTDAASGQLRFLAPIKCLPRSDIKVSAFGTGAANGEASATFTLIEVNKSPSNISLVSESD